MKKINKLKEVFEEYKVYNRTIAGELNKSEATISRWVNNHRQPSLEELYKISKLLKVDIRDLLHPTHWK